MPGVVWAHVRAGKQATEVNARNNNKTYWPRDRGNDLHNITWYYPS